uniref:Uncharacterized protein n=1 Tax=Meloidogyne hapla TaxID=6305 RepID=A0A1I8BSU4_MELHA
MIMKFVKHRFTILVIYVEQQQMMFKKDVGSVLSIHVKNAIRIVAMLKPKLNYLFTALVKWLILKNVIENQIVTLLK